MVSCQSEGESCKIKPKVKVKGSCCQDPRILALVRMGIFLLVCLGFFFLEEKKIPD